MGIYKKTKTKVCTGCHRELPLENFPVRRLSPDGLQPRCRECIHKAYIKLRQKREWEQQKNNIHKVASTELINELVRRGYTGTLRKKREQKPLTETINDHLVMVKEI